MRPDSFQRILISRLRFIGDVILTTPVIRAFRENFPTAKLSFLVEKENSPVLENNPDLNEILTFERNWSLIKQIKFIRHLRQKHFDLAVDFFCNPRSAYLTFLTNAKWRIGYDVRLRGRIYHQRVRVKEKVNAVESHLTLVSALGLSVPQDRTPRVFLSESEKIWAKNFLRQKGIEPGKLLIGLHPGASWPAKRWPKERFFDLATQFMKNCGAKIIWVIGPKEKDLSPFPHRGESERGQQESFLILQNFLLRQLAAVISQCDLFIANDGGPMHLACALGTPTLAIFGPSEPEIWFPYSFFKKYRVVVSQVPCRPCHQDFCPDKTLRCMTELSVGKIFNEAQEILQGTRKNFNY
ncbi:MAG: lipopolysaccharide heptosyltransferase II [Candidatus Edwardsbacteria bacterium]